MEKQGEAAASPILSKEQLAENVRVTGAWFDAVKRATFQGIDAEPISGLVGFLSSENVRCKKALNDALEDDANKVELPSWVPHPRPECQADCLACKQQGVAPGKQPGGAA